MAATQLRVAVMLIIIAVSLVNPSPVPEDTTTKTATASPLTSWLLSDPKYTVSTTGAATTTVTTAFPKYRRDATETTTEEKTTATSSKPFSTTQYPDKVRREDTKGQTDTTPLGISTPSIIGWTGENTFKVTTTESTKYRLRRSADDSSRDRSTASQSERDSDSDSDSRSDSDESTESVKKVPIPVKRETVELTTALWNARDKTYPTTSIPTTSTTV